jgi:hypothetical protein
MSIAFATPILVRNNKSGPTVFAEGTDNGAEVVWGGANDPTGSDVQPVPERFLANNDFLRALSRETFTIESANPDLIEQLAAHLNSPALKAQAAAFKQSQAAQSVASVEVIEDKAQNEIATAPCIGPSARGTGTCGTLVPFKESDKGNKPALCNSHESLASQYVPTEDGGWARAGLAPRQANQHILG